MPLPSLKDVAVAFGGLLGPKGDAYAAGAGGAAAGAAVKLRSSVLEALNRAGAKLGKNLGAGGVSIPGALAAGAAENSARAQADFETKYLGLSVTQMIVAGFVALGGLALWLIRSRR